MPANTHIDFGYPWWLSYGHLPILAIAGVLLALAVVRRWPWWSTGVLGLVVLWSGAAFLLMRFTLNINGVPELPTQSFLPAGTGKVLDIGAGTGRSSIMVLRSRPQATLVAEDLFGQSFDQHFGKGQSPQRRLLDNLKAAGVDGRASIETADMRKLPFAAGSFDAVVSAYAMDHLNREGSDQALAEAARVLKPGGDFLLMLVANERWAKFAFGPMLAHMGMRGTGWWTEHVRAAGFRVVEQGTEPMTLYILSRRAG